jgi:hypothetical protein
MVLKLLYFQLMGVSEASVGPASRAGCGQFSNPHGALRPCLNCLRKHVACSKSRSVRGTYPEQKQKTQARQSSRLRVAWTKLTSQSSFMSTCSPPFTPMTSVETSGLPYFFRISAISAGGFGVVEAGF